MPAELGFLDPEAEGHPCSLVSWASSGGPSRWKKDGQCYLPVSEHTVLTEGHCAGWEWTSIELLLMEPAAPIEFSSLWVSWWPAYTQGPYWSSTHPLSPVGMNRGDLSLKGASTAPSITHFPKTKQIQGSALNKTNIMWPKLSIKKCRSKVQNWCCVFALPVLHMPGWLWVYSWVWGLPLTLQPACFSQMG